MWLRSCLRPALLRKYYRRGSERGTAVSACYRYWNDVWLGNAGGILPFKDPGRQSLVPDQTCMHERECRNVERMEELQEDDMGAYRRRSTYLCFFRERAPDDGSLAAFLLSSALYPTSQLLVPSACTHPCLVGL